MVDFLDEMLINDVKHYAIVKPNTPVDSSVVRLAGENRGKGLLYPVMPPPPLNHQVRNRNNGKLDRMEGIYLSNI